MKFSKLFTKIVAGSAMGIMLMSTAAMANNTVTVTVPSTTYTYSYGTTGIVPLVTPSMTAYADMIAKAKLFAGYDRMVVDRFTHQCISAADLDTAIAAINSASDKIRIITTLDKYFAMVDSDPITYQSKQETLPTAGRRTASTLPDLSAVRTFGGPGTNTRVSYKLPAEYMGLVSDINSLLDKASVGGVELSLRTDAERVDTIKDGNISSTGVTSTEYLGRYYLKAGHTFIDSSMVDWTMFTRYSNSTTGLTSPKDVADKLADYAKLLKSLKEFYATSCGTLTPIDTTSDTTEKTTKDKSTKNAVITAKDKNIKLNSAFNLKAAGVTATDNNGKGKDLTAKITQTGKVDTSKKGTFKVTYYVTGANGAKVSKTVTYTVK